MSSTILRAWLELIVPCPTFYEPIGVSFGLRLRTTFLRRVKLARYSNATSLVFLCTLAQITSAQPLGFQQLTGTILDAGRAAPDIRVVLVSHASTLEVATQTDARGRYSFFPAPVGVYDLQIVRTGSGMIRVPDIAVDQSGMAPVDVDLATGGTGGGGNSGNSETAPPRLTGRAFLSNQELPNFGFYSYVLFAGSPTDLTRDRYEATLRAFVQVITDENDLLPAAVPQKELNITYLPVSGTVRSGAAVTWLVEHYDYAKAQMLLRKLPGDLRTAGPYIVSSVHPLSSGVPGPFLFQDLSVAPPSLIVAWMKEFMVQASRQDSWNERTTAQLVSKLRTNIEIAALALPDARSVSADWKSLLASIIVQK